MFVVVCSKGLSWFFFGGGVFFFESDMLPERVYFVSKQSSAWKCCNWRMGDAPKIARNSGKNDMYR